MAAPGDMPGPDEGFAEIDTQEDEAMEVANSAWEQEVDEVLSGPTATVYFKDCSPGVQGRGIAREEVEQMMQTEAYQRRIDTCHLCGQCWYDGKFGVNCTECGGFPLRRTCPVCDGQCNKEWRRNVKLSHSFHVAHWDGSCGLPAELQRAFQVRDSFRCNTSTVFMPSSILSVYLLRLHNNGHMLDVFWRLHGEEMHFFLPYDLEMSNQELNHVCRHAEQWRGEEGERRKVAVYDYVWEEEELDEDVWDTAYGGEVSEHERQGVKERLRKEITTHVSIHTLHLDGLRDLHRHFLRLPDGAVVEVFGDISVPGMDKDIKKAQERGSRDLPNVSASGAQRKVTYRNKGEKMEKSGRASPSPSSSSSSSSGSSSSGSVPKKKL